MSFIYYAFADISAALLCWLRRRAMRQRYNAIAADAIRRLPLTPLRCRFH